MERKETDNDNEGVWFIYFSEKSPPFPVSQFQITLYIPLYNSNSSSLFNTLLEHSISQKMR